MSMYCFEETATEAMLAASSHTWHDKASACAGGVGHLRVSDLFGLASPSNIQYNEIHKLSGIPQRPMESTSWIK